MLRYLALLSQFIIKLKYLYSIHSTYNTFREVILKLYKVMKANINKIYIAIFSISLLLSILGLIMFLSGPTKDAIQIKIGFEKTIEVPALRNTSLILTYHTNDILNEYCGYNLSELLLNRSIEIQISTENNQIDIYLINCSLLENYKDTACYSLIAERTQYFKSEFILEDTCKNYYLILSNPLDRNTTVYVRLNQRYNLIKLNYNSTFFWLKIAAVCVILILILQIPLKLTIDDIKEKILATIISKIFQKSSKYPVKREYLKTFHIGTLILYIIIIIRTLMVQKEISDYFKGSAIYQLLTDYNYRFHFIVFFLVIVILAMTLILLLLPHYLLLYPALQKLYVNTENFQKFWGFLDTNFINEVRKPLTVISLLVISMICIFICFVAKLDVISIIILMSFTISPYSGFLIGSIYIRTIGKVQSRKQADLLRDFKFIKIYCSLTVLDFLLFSMAFQGFLQMFNSIVNNILNQNILILKYRVSISSNLLDPFLSTINSLLPLFPYASLIMLSFYYFFEFFSVFLSKGKVHKIIRRLLIKDIVYDFIFFSLLSTISIVLQSFVTTIDMRTLLISLITSFIANSLVNYLDTIISYSIKYY